MSPWTELNIDVSTDPEMTALAAEGDQEAVIAITAARLAETRQAMLRDRAARGSLMTGMYKEAFEPSVCRTVKLGSVEMALYIRSLSK